MKKIGFIGAYDKSNFIIYIAKLLQLLGYKVLVLDTTDLQKIRYIIPAINPTKSYITSFEEIDFGVGFEDWDDVEKYLGIKFTSNDEDENEKADEGVAYDYVLIDVDNCKKMDKFNVAEADKKYFVTSFDMFSLKKGIRALDGITSEVDLTRVFFSYEENRQDEEYLDFISLEYKVKWSDYAIYIKILGADNKVFEDNQRIQKIKYKRLSSDYREALTFIIQDIDKKVNVGKLKKAMKD